MKHHNEGPQDPFFQAIDRDDKSTEYTVCRTQRSTTAMDPEQISPQQGGGEASGGSMAPELVVGKPSVETSTTASSAIRTHTRSSFRPAEGQGALDIKILHTNIRTGMLFVEKIIRGVGCEIS